MVMKAEFQQNLHNLEAQPFQGDEVVIFFNLMTAIEQKNPVIPLDHARILHQ
jgi:hypothetical protein